MVKPIVLKNNATGVAYTLEYTRDSAAKMENAGFVVEQTFSKPNIMIPLLWAGAFIAHHDNLKTAEVSEMYDMIPRKKELLSKLIELYNATALTLLDDPDESASGNVDWTAG